MDGPITEHDGGLRIRVYVQPRASRTEVVGLHGDAIKLRVAAPPVEGAANEEVIRFLAKTLAVPASVIEIVSGARGRTKIVHVRGVRLPNATRILLPP